MRRSSQTSDERDLSHNTRARSLPGVFSRACSKTSTCAFCRVDACHGRVETRDGVGDESRARVSVTESIRVSQSRGESRRVDARRGDGEEKHKKNRKNPKKNASLFAQSLRCSIRPHRRRGGKPRRFSRCVSSHHREGPRRAASARSAKREKKRKTQTREKNETRRRRSRRTLFTSGRWS